MRLQSFVTLVVTVALCAGCELFIDVGPETDRLPPDVLLPDGGPAVDAGEIPDAFAGPMCALDPGYLDIGIPGSLYRVLGELPFENGRARCLGEDADAVSINTNAERVELTSLVVSLPTSAACANGPCAWVGLRQLPGALNVNSDWAWPDLSMGQQTWTTGEPDDLDDSEDGDQQCAFIDRDGLNDGDCAVERLVLCECAILPD